jgi:hypothetical protein
LFSPPTKKEPAASLAMASAAGYPFDVNQPDGSRFTSRSLMKLLNCPIFFGLPQN